MTTGARAKRLTELDPHWVGAGGDGITDRDGQPVPARRGVGLAFDCPCGCDSRAYIPFANPLDGGPSREAAGHPQWQRTGDTFETLTLTPSIQRVGGCAWHGFIAAGEIVPC